MVKMILVRGYKDTRIGGHVDANENWQDDLRGCERLDIMTHQHNDCFTLVDASHAINAALKAAGCTDQDVISITAVPHQINERDRGSHDYYVAVRDK
jgi:hypothetical protein